MGWSDVLERSQVTLTSLEQGHAPRTKSGVFDFISRLAFPGEASSNSKPSDTRPLVDLLDKWPRLILKGRGYRDN